MEKFTLKNVFLALAAFFTALAGVFGINQLGAINQPEITIFTTSTNANYSGVNFSNVNDFTDIGFTVVADNASGTVRFACSMQDTEPTQAATSTSNRWDYVDFVNTETEASVDGYTGIVLSNSSAIKQLVIRNSQWKWCTARLSGNTSQSGVGTTTLYMKRVNNNK